QGPVQAPRSGVEPRKVQSRSDWNSPSFPPFPLGFCGCIRELTRPEQERTPMIGLLVRTLSPLRFDEEGQTLVEYALILLLVSTAAVTLLSTLGAFPSSVFSSVNAHL